MRIVYIIAIVGIVGVGIWFLRGLLASRVERPDFNLLSNDGMIEIRHMKSQIHATVTVSSSESQAPNKAFGLLANFIFGNNKRRDKVAMTAPVLSQKSTPSSETIAMTAPVLSQSTKTGSYDVSFVMPAQYTLETLPIPNNDRVRIHPIPAKTVAVIVFDGYTTASRIDTHRNKLLDHLKSKGIKTIGESYVAQYNDPWTPPVMRTNEIWIEIEYDSQTLAE